MNKAKSNNSYFDESLCIFCQKVCEKKLVSSENGKKSIRELSQLKKDVVFNRLNLLPKNGK